MSTLQAWREEGRRDRLTQAQIDRDRDTARIQSRIAERQAIVQIRRDEAQAKAVAAQQARKARAARRAARASWLSGHAVDLLFVPVIVVPAVLAWTAMAAYGCQLYGPPGLALPALSEGGMWTFAGATTITRRKHPGKPLWHLRAGTVVFAAYGAALNFLHGMTAQHGPHGPGVAAVYALVSVAGVTAHQLVTAGPRRSRAERNAARIARAAGRREMAARRAALRDAVADVDEHGNARLVYRPGRAVIARRGGRTRLSPAPDGRLNLPPSGPACPWPRPVPVLPSAPGSPAPGNAPTGAPAPRRTRKPRKTAHRTAGAPGSRTGTVTGESAEVHFAAELADGQAPSVRRIKSELHVGQDRAQQIHDHLTAVANAPRVHTATTT